MCRRCSNPRHRDVALVVGQAVSGTQPTAHEDARDRRRHAEPPLCEVADGIVQAGREEQDCSVGEHAATAQRGSGCTADPGQQAGYVGTRCRLSPADGKEQPAYVG